MIANLINALVGLWLAYASIFAMPTTTHAPWEVAMAGVVIVALAFAARRSDFSGWQSATNIVLGIVLAVIMMVDWKVRVAPLFIFWIDLCVGLTVSSLGLWAALYHPERQKDSSSAVGTNTVGAASS